jgi:hypothetical protein
LPLDVEALQHENIHVVIVTAPQHLGRAEAESLTRFAHDRGGSVVLLLDAVPSGALASLVPGKVVERHEAVPVTIGPLKAAELIVQHSGDVATTVLAAAAAEPIVTSRAVGRGRVITSGAIDAWRYRAEGKFDSFWRSLVAQGASAAGAPLTARLSSNRATVGEPVDLDVEWRSTGEPEGTLAAQATLDCAGKTWPIRLWPSARRGSFRGVIEATSSGICDVHVDVRPLGHRALRLTITDKPNEPFTERDELAAALTALGGSVVDAGNESALVAYFRDAATSQRIATDVHPMRSPWWIVPFVTCLGTEWWLRRRIGRR